MAEDRHEIERAELIHELDAEMRCWQHLNVRRGVKRLVEVVRDRLANGGTEVRSRLEAAALVTNIGMNERGWIPCDVLAVSEGIRTGGWMKMKEELGGPVCSMCRKRQDGCRADGWGL